MLFRIFCHIYNETMSDVRVKRGQSFYTWSFARSPILLSTTTPLLKLKLFNMLPKKCFFTCEGKLSLFGFPKEDSAKKDSSSGGHEFQQSWRNIDMTVIKNH